ncbi:hypothetical protein FJ936_13450 [Mesorhizobium sp. B2-4-13]|uniref:hypothetical protein n=1 Tax=Mesorhizobium sp. B2-4-13 TaxID=2589936 RepID=UPI0011515EBB|nr:hypothetical protein [Mesorhizobium sp. B2-4-13]TPK84878.1 hypothetical protein FJ936_13450 [Mesorhizobium sp. B2-4-13]
MADLAQPATIQWEEFSQLAAVPAHSRVASVVKSPDGRSLSILIEGLDAQCEGNGKKSATAVLVGSIEANIPAKTDWTATRADFRGQLALTNGARATVELGLARSVEGQTTVAPLQGGADSIEFVRTLYSPSETALHTAEGEAPSYAPLTISVQLTLTCPGKDSAALAAVDSVDLELWLR